MIKKISIIFFSVLFIVGCFSSPYKRYFQINIENSNSMPTKSNTSFILIKDVKTNDFYNDYRLVYRTSPYELNYYSYDFWVVKPEQLIKKAFIDYINKSKFSFINDFSDIKPKYYIEMYVEAIEVIDNGNIWFGRLAVNIKLYDFNKGKYLMTYDFDDKIRMGRKKIELFPRVISRILQKNIDGFIQKLIETDKKQHEEIKND